MPEEELDKIFDPFFRHDISRDPTTGGVGLGLTIVKTCIESCGGTVSARNLAPQGLEVTLQLRPVSETREGVNALRYPNSAVDERGRMG